MYFLLISLVKNILYSVDEAMVELDDLTPVKTIRNAAVNNVIAMFAGEIRHLVMKEEREK